MQFQRPYVAKGGQISIFSPNSKWNKWVELVPPKMVSITTDLWEPNLGSREFIVKTSNNKAKYFVMAYCSGVISSGLDESLHVSKYGKIYPKAINLKEVSAGDSHTITGYFGFVPSSEIAFNRKQCEVVQ